MTKKFATAISCIDGRTHKPVIEFIQKTFGVDFVDMITEPGPNQILAEGKDSDIIELIKKKVEISIDKHHSQIIAIAAHYDCAGNPKNENAQKEDLRMAVKAILSWGFPVKNIIALWLDKNFIPSITT